MKAMKAGQRWMRVAVFASLTACTPLWSRDRSAEETLRMRPPGNWNSAVAFYLVDSMRVEFFDGLRTRVVTPNATIQNDSMFGRTPWYRLRFRKSSTLILHLTSAYGAAGRVTAESPLEVRTDGYFEVRIFSSPRNPRTWSIGATIRSYPLPPGIASEPGDSLWVMAGGRSRDCFSCPH